jgi:4'-phosphopantetheinyl transferase
MRLPRPDEIEVIPFPLEGEGSMSLDLANSWLNQEERGRAERFRFPVHRERFIRGRGMLRRLLAAYLETDPAAITFEVGEKGKPYLPGSAIHFNLSHSEGRAVLAVSRLPSIGIDIECFDRKVNVDGLSRRCFRESEISGLLELPEEEKRRAFFWIWTAKEARMKATGEGFSLEPQCIEITFENGLPHACLEPCSPAAHVAPVFLPDGDAACTVAALSPFTVTLGEVPY